MNVVEEVQTTFAGSGRPDTTKGIVPGVLIVGLESKNGRSYPSATLKAAVGLYEGVKVNLDHPQKPQDSRSVKDRIGVIRNARFMEGKGIVGDFHYNPQHPLASQIAWDAEHNPKAVGFSHNANLALSRGPGRPVVERIDSVRSVDLVADPATTNGFFESVKDGFKPTLTEAEFVRRIQPPKVLGFWR